jgi:hypothetical protein
MHHTVIHALGRPGQTTATPLRAASANETAVSRPNNKTPNCRSTPQPRPIPPGPNTQSSSAVPICQQSPGRAMPPAVNPATTLSAPLKRA